MLFPEIAGTFELFIAKLYQALQAKHVKHVFFLAREGAFLQELFEAYQKKLPSQSRIQTHYLLVSRYATFLPSLQPLPKETFEQFFFRFPKASLADFLQSLQFSSTEIQHLQDLCSDRNPSLFHSPSWSKLLASTDFKKWYEEKRAKQKANFLSYLQSFNFDWQQGMYVVDIGWQGSIQDNIFAILDQKVPISGYYLGLMKSDQYDSTNLKTGLLFSDIARSSPCFSIYNQNRTLFEVIAGTPHGMVLGYENSQPVTDPDREEIKLFQEKIVPFHQHILSTLKGDTPSAVEVAKKHARMVFLPRKEEVEFFRTLSHREQFGLFQTTNFAKVIQNKKVAPICWRLLTLYNTHIPGLWRVYGWWQYFRYGILVTSSH